MFLHYLPAGLRPNVGGGCYCNTSEYIDRIFRWDNRDFLAMILQTVQIVCLGCAFNLTNAVPTGDYNGKPTTDSNAEGVSILVFTYLGVLAARHIGSTSQELLNAWCETRLRAFLTIYVDKQQIKADSDHYLYPQLDKVSSHLLFSSLSLFLFFISSLVFAFCRFSFLH
jgi:hypothetical protein